MKVFVIIRDRSRIVTNGLLSSIIAKYVFGQEAIAMAIAVIAVLIMIFIGE